METELQTTNYFSTLVEAELEADSRGLDTFILLEISSSLGHVYQPTGRSIVELDPHKKITKSYLREIDNKYDNEDVLLITNFNIKALPH